MTLPVLQPELRALDVFDVILAGHFGLLIASDAFAPHLGIGPETAGAWRLPPST